MTFCVSLMCWQGAAKTLGIVRVVNEGDGLCFVGRTECEAEARF